MNSLIGQIKKAKEAALKLASIDGKTKNRALIYLEELIKQNKKDIEKAKASNLNESLIKRLMLDEKKLNEVIEIIESVKALEDPIGKITEKIELDKNLILEKITVPIGLIGAIFESRPDATIQISSLCIKSGNAAILKKR